MRSVREHTWEPLEGSALQLSNAERKEVPEVETEAEEGSWKAAYSERPWSTKSSSPKVQHVTPFRADTEQDVKPKTPPEESTEAETGREIHDGGAEAAMFENGLESLLENSRKVAENVKTALEESRALNHIGKMAGRVRREIETDVNALRKTLEEESANLGLLQKYQQQENLVLRNQLGYLSPPTVQRKHTGQVLPLSSAPFPSQSVLLLLVGLGLMNVLL